MWQERAMPDATVAAGVCAKMVEAATRSCPATTPLASAQAANPNWDAIAVALTAQSNAISFGAVVLAIIIAVAGLAWGKIITLNAEREARDMAKACADAYISKWLAEEAPGIIREQVDLIIDATIGSGNDAQAADDLGEGAG